MQPCAVKSGTLQHNNPGPGVKEQGLDPDEAIAKQMGLGKASEMSELQEKYKDKMKDRLANVRPSMHPFV